LIIISQNAANYNVKFPKDCVFRINLAWCNSLTELKEILKRHEKHEIFVDLPINRIKPPNNSYSLNELFPIIERNKQIKYFAVSNVETADDLTKFQKSIPEWVTIIPKIESPKGIENIQEITKSLNYAKKYVMLDHDDLFSAIIKRRESYHIFQNHIKKLVDFCQENNISLLRTVGVIFSDDEKRTTQYVK
tara:strand:- start:178 stop:750 length:573 start_codon:yes stop_codon:yes gene_type:complete